MRPVKPVLSRAHHALHTKSAAHQKRTQEDMPCMTKVLGCAVCSCAAACRYWKPHLTVFAIRHAIKSDTIIIIYNCNMLSIISIIVITVIY